MSRYKNTKKEWRARVANKDNFEWRKQIWPEDKDEENYPYNSEGIRAVGGKLKNLDKVKEQSIRFNTSKRFGWTESKIKEYIENSSFEMDSLVKVFSTNDQPMHKRTEHMVYIRSTEEFAIKAVKGKDGKRLIVGVASSDQVDKHNEIVAPFAVMASKDEYMEFPTVRLMHDAEPIGSTLDLWQEGNKIMVEIEIHDDEDRIWHKIQKGYLRALSIGFRVLDLEEYCPNGLEKECFIRFTEIMLVEISVVDSPANTDAIFEVKKQLMKIGGEALVDRMIMKVEDNEQGIRTSDIGDEVEKIIEMEDEGVKMENENKEVEETEEVEAEPETAPVAQEEETTEEETTEEETSETEEEEDFIPAEEGEEEEDPEPEETKETEAEEEAEAEPDTVKSEMIEMRSDIELLKDAVSDIKETLESMSDENLSEMKALKEENEKLKSQLEEKKLPKRQSYKDKAGAPEEETKEGVDFGRSVAIRQLKKLATTKN
jgi:HK97 family phage prohead protease